MALAPMPRANVMATVKVKPGSRASRRSVPQVLAGSSQPVPHARAHFARFIDSDEPGPRYGEVSKRRSASSRATASVIPAARSSAMVVSKWKRSSSSTSVVTSVLPLVEPEKPADVSHGRESRVRESPRGSCRGLQYA